MNDLRAETKAAIRAKMLRRVPGFTGDEPWLDNLVDAAVSAVADVLEENGQVDLARRLNPIFDDVSEWLASL